jgi:hypothetical protein
MKMSSKRFYKSVIKKIMIKRPILLLAFMALCTHPSIGLASYLVQLTNGNQFITNGYWEDGAQIRFYSSGGAVAVSKASVRQIRETDRPVSVQTDRKPIILSPKAPNRVPQEDGSKEQTSEGTKKANATATLDDYRERKRLLQAELDKALEGFREASGHGNPEAKKKAIRDITEASGQMLKLTDEVKEKNNGVLPDWWEGS